MKVKAYCNCGVPILVNIFDDGSLMEVMHKLIKYKKANSENPLTMKMWSAPYVDLGECPACKASHSILRGGLFRWTHYKEPMDKERVVGFVNFTLS